MKKKTSAGEKIGAVVCVGAVFLGLLFVWLLPIVCICLIVRWIIF